MSIHPRFASPAAASIGPFRREEAQARLQQLHGAWAQLYGDARSGDADACCGLAYLLSVYGDSAGAEHRPHLRPTADGPASLVLRGHFAGS